MSLIDDLQWRYAAKRLNGNAVPDEVLKRLLEATRLAPSSFGLQPWSVVHVRDAALRRHLYDTAAPQPQVVEGSDLLVFAVHDTDYYRQVDDHIARTARTRGVAESELDGFRRMIKGVLEKQGDHAAHLEWAAQQAYLGLGVAIAAAAAERVDASPMEGFDASALDAALGLEKRGLKSRVLLALGYRDEARDSGASRVKVRPAMAEFVHRPL